MNIRHEGMWVEQIPPQLQINTPDAWREILILRHKTFQGFAKIEEKNGLLAPDLRLNASGAQDVIRLFIMRGLEETMEARQATSRDHYLEEMIDAFNFFSSIFIMDSLIPSSSFCQHLSRGWSETRGVTIHFSFPEHIYTLLVKASPLLEKLRNRSWQQNAQSTYFDGMPQMIEFSEWIGASFCWVFEKDWDMFVHYFLAKDNVLQFRLRSLY